MTEPPAADNAVWIFHQAGARFAGGAFATKTIAEEWIAQHRLSGVLTKYPLDQGVWDWAVAQGRFKPTRDEHRAAEFVGGFTSAFQDHHHYVEGVAET